jgi:hypothetical protein
MPAPPFKPFARNGNRSIEQRRSHRFPPQAIPGLKAVHLGTGPEVELVNISRGGALLESTTRLPPSTNICLRLVAGASSFVLRGRILRSHVAGYLGNMLKYQSAISFSQEFSLLPAQELPAREVEAPHPPQANPPIPPPVAAPEISMDDIPASPPVESADAGFTCTARCSSYEVLEAILQVNDW